MAELIFVFVVGAIVGSFLNVCIHRLPRRESIIRPPSHCPNCKKPIPWRDNIPLLSFILLGGRCRFCRDRIAWRYFIVELLTAGAFLALYMFLGLSVKFFFSLLFLSLLIVATFVDFEHEEIPDEVSVGGLILALVLSAVFPTFMGAASPGAGLARSVFGAIAGGVSIYLVGALGKIAFRRDAMGEGDVKLMAMIGAFLGARLVMLSFFIAPLFGSIFGIALKIKTGKDTMPYGPFLSLSAVIALLCGDKILQILFVKLW